MSEQSMYVNIKGELIDFSLPRVMGILNITPDSFYENSRKQSEVDIIDRVKQIVEEGGDIVDIGAQSTRPNSAEISAEEELKRLSFALNVINREFPKLTISVDTFYSKVARYVVEKHDVAIINDISGGYDENMFKTVAELSVPYVLMHIQGTPQTMHSEIEYTNFIQNIFYFFSDKIRQLRELGVKDIIVDPGFGFSKSMDGNYELMKNLDKFQVFDCPILAGISRKRMIYQLLDSDAQNALNGTTVLNSYALTKGANILRVHDVKEALETIKIMSHLK